MPPLGAESLVAPLNQRNVQVEDTQDLVVEFDDV
jgi:hypothetical protein